MELGLVRKIDIDHEMQQAYLDYAMSVIVARALPDARDGLKPVQRRILYAMYDMGLRPDSPYKKSARIVGEVLGKYHPHGDAAVYEAMARMAQDFSMRTLLVDGQGNFGSIDGDPPAAMRYTEARLAAAAMHLLADIGKNTVDFVSNFDDTLQEPSVLPAAFPNLLVNGATGIAVGMATSIPPHNLGEVVDALVYLLDRWEKMDDIDLEQLMEFIQGPDFPSGGVIIEEKGEEGIEAAYGSGRGRVTVQAKVHIEEMERGRSRLLVSELPYTVNKSALIERIAELARQGQLEGLADLRDESDRQGMRIVIELSKNADPQAVLRELYRRTPMQTTFSIILLALVDGEPRLLTLKQALRVYLEHRLTVIRRRSEHDLEKAKQRAHILEGYLVALKNLDELIHLIRNAADAETARTKMMKRYALTEIQANAILDMQLRRLAALERQKIESEYREATALIKDLEGLLKSPKRMRGVAAEELLRVKEEFGDRRRTQIVSLRGGKRKSMILTATDLLPEEKVYVSIQADGRVMRTREDRLPRRSGNEAARSLVRASTRDTLYLVTENGRAAAIAVHTLPEAEAVPYFKISALSEEEPLAAAFALPARRSSGAEETYVLSITRGGLVKKSAVADLPGPSSQAFTLAKVNEGDRLGWVLLSDGKKDILLISALGMAIRFREDEVRPMGLVAAGVSGMKLENRDEVVGCEVLPAEGDVFILAANGHAKRLAQKEFPRQGRYGKGVSVWNLPRGVRLVGSASGKASQVVILHTSKGTPRSCRLDAASLRKRAAARGDAVAEMRAGESVVALTSVWDLDRFIPRSEAARGTAKTKRKAAQKAASKRAAGQASRPRKGK